MIPKYIRDAMTALNGASYECYIVGGAVRDTLRGVNIHDYDLTTSALPDQTVKAMTEAGFKTIIDSSAKYGTVVFIRPGQNEKIEITTFRGEGDYEDSRHPDEVLFGVSLEQDALRRDFTINSMYMDKDENIIDPNNGQQDIKDEVIRAIGDPVCRFKEDALRILRAVRFQAKTGFIIEENTHRAMIACKELLHNISSERIFAELTGIVTAPGGSAAIRDNLEVIGEIIPELLLQRGFDQKSRYHDKTLLEHTLAVLDGIPVESTGDRNTVLAYAALLHDIGKPEVFVVDEEGFGHMKKHAPAGVAIAQRIAAELKFPNNLRDEVKDLVLHHDSFAMPERKSVKRFINKLGPEFCKKLFVLQRADIMAHSEFGRKRLELLEGIVVLYEEIMAESPCLSIKELAITGDDLASLGVPRSPVMGDILKAVLEQVLEENIVNEKSALLEYVSEKYL